jgi:hypothetical protein
MAPAPQGTTTTPRAAARHTEALGPSGGGWHGQSEPFSATASNIVPADTTSVIAPRLPVPAIGENASPEQFLNAAEAALKKHQTGIAEEALERAESRLLDRATDPAAADRPDNSPRIADIAGARRALGGGDLTGARQLVAQALSPGATDTHPMPAMSPPASMGTESTQPAPIGTQSHDDNGSDAGPDNNRGN